MSNNDTPNRTTSYPYPDDVTTPFGALNIAVRLSLQASTMMLSFGRKNKTADGYPLSDACTDFASMVEDHPSWGTFHSCDCAPITEVIPFTRYLTEYAYQLARLHDGGKKMMGDAVRLRLRHSVRILFHEIGHLTLGATLAEPPSDDPSPLGILNRIIATLQTVHSDLGPVIDFLSDLVQYDRPVIGVVTSSVDTLEQLIRAELPDNKKLN